MHIFIIIKPGRHDAESLINLANNMAMRGHKVTIGASDPVNPVLYPFYRLGHTVYKASLPGGQRPKIPCFKPLSDLYELHPSIKIIPCYLGDNNLKLQKQRQQIIKLAPDVCVYAFSDSTYLIASVLMLGSGIPCIYSEMDTPAAVETELWNRKGRLAAMSAADFIHLQLAAYSANLPDFLANRAAIIPPAIKGAFSPITPAEPVSKKNILLWHGKLNENLSQCRLAIGAFNRARKNYCDWEMRVVGNGPDYHALRTYAASLNCAGNIKFFTDSPDMGEHYASANAFCFSSSSKDNPKNLLQAMAAGLPCSAFADYEGVRDIIISDVNGLLASQMNINCMAKTLEKLFASAELRSRLGKEARNSLNKFSENHVYDKWESLLKQAARKKGNLIMDSFYAEPFASMARLSSAARREFILRDFGQPTPLGLTWFAHKAKNIFNNAIAQPLRKKIRSMRKAFAVFKPEDFACIVRSVGERTTIQCMALLDEAFAGKVPIKLLQVQPFTEALRQTMLLGAELNKKWTLVLDADVLIQPDALIKFLALSRLANRNAFMLHASVCDKFFIKPRQAGNRLYRTEFMEKALESIPPEGKSYRPESELCNRMQAKGYPIYRSDIIIGLHDYEQEYEDIFRKALLFGLKHKKSIANLLKFWNINLHDQDYAAALEGLSITMDKNQPIIIDKNIVSISAEDSILKWKAISKKALPHDQFNGFMISEIIKNEMEDRNLSIPDSCDIMEYKR